MSSPHASRGHYESLLLLKSLQSATELGPGRLAEAAQHLKRQAGLVQQRLQRQAQRIAAGLQLGQGACAQQPTAAFCSVSLSGDRKRKRKVWLPDPVADLSEWSNSKHAHSSDSLPPPSPENDRHLLSEVRCPDRFMALSSQHCESRCCTVDKMILSMPSFARKQAE